MQESVTIPSIKSRPVYPLVELDRTARCHVFICQTVGYPALAALLSGAAPEGSLMLIVGAAEVASVDIPVTTIAASDWQGAVASTLSEVTMATALYVAGSEDFLWAVHRLGLAAGLAAEQIRLLPPVSRARKVFCTHCYEATDNVTVTPMVCSGCGRTLLVRDHFSRLHGAYVGVQIDAEVAGVIPPPEELR